MCKQYTADDEVAVNRWVRTQPLLVIIYEGIIEGVFDYDYALRLSASRAHLHQHLKRGGTIWTTCARWGISRSQAHVGELPVLTALRINEGFEYLEKHLDDESKAAVDALIFKGSHRERRAGGRVVPTGGRSV